MWKFLIGNTSKPLQSDLPINSIKKNQKKKQIETDSVLNSENKWQQKGDCQNMFIKQFFRIHQICTKIKEFIRWLKDIDSKSNLLSL